MHLRLEDFSKGKPYFANQVFAKRPYPTHSQDFYELMHFTSGTGFHIINGVRHTVRAGQSWHITRCDTHSIEPDRQGLSWLNVAFSSDSWLKFVELTKLDAHSGLLATSSPTPFEAALKWQNSSQAHWELASLLIAVFTPSRPEEGGQEWLKLAVGALDEGENLRLGVAAMVTKGSVSPSHLSRSIRAEYGITPTELVNLRRLERSTFLLATSSAKATEISLECGFESVSYFYRLFRERYGETPLSYRRRIRAVPGFVV